MERCKNTNPPGTSRAGGSRDIFCIPKRHFFLHAIPVLTIIAIVAIAQSGIDGKGSDLPGLLRLLTAMLGTALWSLLFASSMGVHIFQNKRWSFLALAVLLLLVRVIYFSEIAWGEAEGHLYLCLPVEYILYYVIIHTDTELTKLGFVLITAMLYALCWMPILSL